MWSVEFTASAAKAFARLPRNVQRLVDRKLSVLAGDPHAPNNNVKKLTGREGYRLRVGDWRVIYDLDRGRLIVLVLDLGPRGSVYD